MLKTYQKLWNLLLIKEKKQAFFLLILMIIYGLIETFGVVSVFPLISVLTNPNIIETNKYLNFTYTYLNFQSFENFLIFFSSIVFCITLTRTLFNGLVNHLILRYTQIRCYSLSSRLLQSYLNRPYIYFLSRHSAEMGNTPFRS